MRSAIKATTSALPLLAAASLAPAGTILVPEDAATIQAAVDLAGAGDVIELADGVYVGPGNRNVEFGGKLLTIRSANGPENCVIDCQFLGRAFRALADEPPGTRLEGLTITHGFVGGTNQQAGAIEVAAGASLEVVDCRLVANMLGMKGRGGAIACFGTLHLEGCLFEGNKVSEDFSLGAAVLASGELSIVDCAFVENSTNEGLGGALAAYGPTTIVDTSFVGNHAKYGGAIEGPGALSISGCAFTGNSALALAGAIRVIAGAEIADSLFLGNSSATAGGLSVGGPLVASRCRFLGNEAGAGGGGAIRVATSTTVELRDSLLAGNAATGTGGGLLLVAGSALLGNCTVAFNTQATAGPGAGIRVEEGSTLAAGNAILWGNTAAVADLQGQQVGGLGAIGFDACCVEGLDGSLGGAGNIGAPPLFVDPMGPDGVTGTEDDDLRLQASSPCVDTGANAFLLPDQTIDLDGAPRLVDGDGDGEAIVDMGASERPAPTPPADLDGDGIVDGADLGLLLAAWGTDGPGDLDGSGTVDGADLGLLLSAWRG